MPTKIIQHGPVLEWRWGTDNPLMPEPYWTSCFLLDGLLIDAGPPAGADNLQQFLTQLPDEQAITQCFVTHAHEDHAGGASMLHEALRIPIYASEKASRILAEGYTYPDYRQLAWGERLLPVPAIPLNSGSIATRSREFNLDLVPMPGHAPCLVALLDRAHQLVFVGDAVLPKYRMLFGETSSIQEDIKQIYTSIQRLHDATSGMETLEIFIPGHGVIEGRTFLGEKMAEIESLHQQARELNDLGLDERKILKRMFNGETFIASFTRGEMSRLNLLRSLLGWSFE
jgi:endoribonuclease LACTB2